MADKDKDKGLRGSFAGPALDAEVKRRKERDLVGDDFGAQDDRLQVIPRDMTIEEMNAIDEQRRADTLPGHLDTRPSNIGDISGIAEYEAAQYIRDIPSGQDVKIDYGEAYDIDPYAEMAGSAQAGDAYADQHALDASYRSLDTFNEMAELGYSEDEFAAMDQMQQRQETDLRGGEMAQYELMEAQGIGGSSLEGVQALNSAQMQAQQGAMQDIERAAAVEERKRYGTRQAGELGSELADQSFQQDFMRGQARDEAARAQADMVQGYEEKRAKEQEQAALANIGNTQDRFGQQAWGVGGLSQKFSGDRSQDLSTQAGIAGVEMGTPTPASSWYRNVTGAAGLARDVYDEYKDSKADEKKREDDAEKATREKEQGY